MFYGLGTPLNPRMKARDVTEALVYPESTE